MAMNEPFSIWRLDATLGEGPVWVARDAALWFTDIKQQFIHRFDPVIRSKFSWETPGQCGFVLPLSGGGFVAGLQSGLHYFDERDGSFRIIADPEPDSPDNRLNDATVDSQGRLWFGTMDDAEQARTGAIYCLKNDATIARTSPFFCITNGPAISPDGQTLYHVDTLSGIIYACSITESGELIERRIFTTIPNCEGYPDGPTVDAEGCVWICLFAGWAARRYAPTGELLCTVEFPVANITKLAFGGADLKTAYVTTATKGMSSSARADQPEAGDLFSFAVSTPGIPSHEISLDSSGISPRDGDRRKLKPGFDSFAG
jgi:xylono-1,5-lactonase